MDLYTVQSSGNSLTFVIVFLERSSTKIKDETERGEQDFFLGELRKYQGSL